MIEVRHRAEHLTVGVGSWSLEGEKHALCR